MIFTGMRWLLNGVNVDAAALGKWLSSAECAAAIAMRVGEALFFYGRGKCVRLA